MALTLLRRAVLAAIVIVTLLLAASVTPRKGRVLGDISGYTRNPCPLYPASALVPCAALGENEGCHFCREVDRFCQTVSEADEFHVQDPDTGLHYRVPEGRWCLPPVPATQDTCNPNTAVPVLTQTPDGELRWGCLCTKPLLVVNEGGYGDCTKVVACDPSLGGRLVHRDTGAEWSADPTWDPAVFGVCDCPEGYKYVAKEDGDKRCLVDECSPGHSIGVGRCQCPERVVDDKGQHVSFVEHQGTCIADPCNPLGYTEAGTCRCNKGSSAVQDAGVVGKWICEDVCSPRRNPCGKRGRCYAKADSTPGCRDCTSLFYQSERCDCGNEVKLVGPCSMKNECLYRCCLGAWGVPSHCFKLDEKCGVGEAPLQDLDARYGCHE